MENIPIDIIEDIFSRLSVEPTLQCKRVCKTWRNLFGKSKIGLLFAYADIYNIQYDYQTDVQLYYGDKYEENIEQYYSTETLAKLDGGKYDLCIPGSHFTYYHHMVGSCNGLVCFQRDINRVPPFGGIFNPVTGEILSLSLHREAGVRWRSVGFGYLASTNEYKVVRCSYTEFNDFWNWKGHVELYTLGSQSGWRGKQNLPYCFCGSSIFVNGAIHWIGKGCHWMGNMCPARPRVYKIVIYDLTDEKFKNAISLPFDYKKFSENSRSVLMGGNLCALQFIFGGPIIIWVFKKRRIEHTRILRPIVTKTKYYDHNCSWSEEFSIAIADPEKYKYRPFAITMSNQVLLWHEDEHRKLYCYDNDTSTLTKLWDSEGKRLSWIEAIPHMNTLVSIKELAERSGNSMTLDNDEISESKVSIQRKKRKFC